MIPAARLVLLGVLPVLMSLAALVDATLLWPMLGTVPPSLSTNLQTSAEAKCPIGTALDTKMKDYPSQFLNAASPGTARHL